MPSVAERIAALYTAASELEAAAAAAPFYPEGARGASDEAAQFARAVADTVAAMAGPDVDARNYGWIGGDNAAANSAALVAAIQAASATGARVIVRNDADYTCSYFTLTDCPVNLEFVGTGRCLTDGAVMRLTASFAGIQSVTSIASAALVIDGVSTPVTKIQIADVSQYTRGDLVRVVSADLEPNSDGSTRRKGEVAPVIYVEPGAIYTPRLIDTAAYVTNVRVGRYSKLRCRIKGFTSRGTLNTAVTEETLVLEGWAYPKCSDLEFQQNGWTAITLFGCAMGDFDDLRGDGVGTAAGSLGYLVNDAGGHGNRFSRVTGRFWRHLLTTNMTTTTNSSDARLGRFGMCRYHTVVNSVAEGCQGAAFDEHPGAYGTKWLNCRALGCVSGAIVRFAFQIRGGHTQVIDCDSDHTYSRHVAVLAESWGTHRIAGGNCKSRAVTGGGQAGTQILLDGINCESVASDCWSVSTGTTLYVNGGRFRMTATTNGAVLGNVASGVSVFLNNPLFEIDYAAGTTGGGVFAAAAGAARIQGKYRLCLVNTGALAAHVVNSSSALSLIVAAQLIGANTRAIPATSGTAPAEARYAVTDFTGGANHLTNISTVDDVVRYLAPL